jgi:DNA-binding MarR family transcriptional regulator
VRSRQSEPPPFSASAVFLVAELGESIASRFAQVLKPIGLRPKHCRVLSLLADGVPESQLELGRRLGVVPSAVVSMLDELEVLGAVVRKPDRSDRRRHSVELTPKGRRLFRRSQEVAHGLDLQLMESLDPVGRANFLATLREIALPRGATSPVRP